MRPARARRQVEADHGELAEVGLAGSGLRRRTRGCRSRCATVRGGLRVERDAAVALALAPDGTSACDLRGARSARGTSSCCALISCRHTTSHGSMRASQRAKPLRSAERMPLTLSVMMRMSSGVGRTLPRRGVYTSDAAPAALGAGGRGSRGIICGRTARRATPFMSDFRQEFLAFALARDVLRFGEFVTKAGRKSPYFFNAGLFNDGESLRRLGRFYAQASARLGRRVAISCSDRPTRASRWRRRRRSPWPKRVTICRTASIARKPRITAKAASSSARRSKGRVLIVDDVITDGGAKRESIELIRAHGATPPAC